MNFINDLIDELNTSNYHFLPSVIEEFNTFVIHKLLAINEIYKNDFDKYYLLGNLVNLGHELENISTAACPTLSSQLNFFSGLFKPVVNKIREICLKLNLELVNEYKNQIGNLIMSNIEKYNVQKKNIKFIQVNCFCKNTFAINKEIMFGEFGISIKITNLHFKDIFKNLLEETNLPNCNLQNYLRDKKTDWYWKAIEYTNYSNISDELNKQNKFDTDFIEPTYPNNLDNSNESFKIIQKNPELIQSSLSSNVSNFSNVSNEYTLIQNINIIKQTDKKISSIIANSIVIDDDSFSIPIDLDDNLTTMTNANL